jgi:hypothetical protein
MYSCWVRVNTDTNEFRVSKDPDSTYWYRRTFISPGDVTAEDWEIYQPEISSTVESKGTILVDLDGTLAEYHGMENTFNIGKPIPSMVSLVNYWLKTGFTVKIFTARVDGGEVARIKGLPADICDRYNDVEAIKKMIQDWCEFNIGVRLEVTNKKDFDVVQIWDDRAVGVVSNTGKRIG